jgi:replicative DNA helicase
VFIDYLQIMDRPDAKGRNEASVIGEMTKGLKQLAREAETCVVLLSQINRGVESRDDKRPQLSDLRESGAIEQDANAVLFPYREAYYLERAEPKDVRKQGDWEMACAEMHRRMDVIAAKVRQGAESGPTSAALLRCASISPSSTTSAPASGGTNEDASRGSRRPPSESNPFPPRTSPEIQLG